MRAIYSAAERKYAALSAKYTWILSPSDAAPAEPAKAAPAKGKGAVEEAPPDDAPIVVRPPREWVVGDQTRGVRGWVRGEV